MTHSNYIQSRCNDCGTTWRVYMPVIRDDLNYEYNNIGCKKIHLHRVRWGLGSRMPQNFTVHSYFPTSLEIFVSKVAALPVGQWRLNEFESGGETRRALHFFGSTTTISRFAERFRDVQY